MSNVLQRALALHQQSLRGFVAAQRRMCVRNADPTHTSAIVKGLIDATIKRSAVVAQHVLDFLVKENELDLPLTANAFDPEEPRDEKGEWTSGGGGGSTKATGFKKDASSQKVNTVIGHQQLWMNKSAQLYAADKPGHELWARTYVEGVKKNSEYKDMERKGWVRIVVIPWNQDIWISSKNVNSAQRDVLETEAINHEYSLKQDYGKGAKTLYKPPTRNRLGAITNAGQYAFLTTDSKLKAFNQWLQQQLDAHFLGLEGQTDPDDPFSAEFVTSAYRQGLVSSYLQTHKQDLALDAPGYNASQATFLRDTFAQPETMAKVQMLGTRVFEEMKGLAAAEKSTLGRILAQGLIDGSGMREVARDMVEQIADMSRSRAEMIARTEIIRVHAEGQLDGYEALGVEQLGIDAELLNAGDNVVCDDCEAAAQDGPYSIDDARGMIPLHPRCRCSWIPAFNGQNSAADRETYRSEHPDEFDQEGEGE